MVSPGTLHGRLGDVPISHIHKRGMPLTTDREYAGVPVASLDSLCAHKCNGRSGGGERKDVLDRFGLALGGITLVLQRAFQCAPGLNQVHVTRSLTVFTASEATPLPEVLAPWSWDTVRDALRRMADPETLGQLEIPGPGLP